MTADLTRTDVQADDRLKTPTTAPVSLLLLFGYVLPKLKTYV